LNGKFLLRLIILLFAFITLYVSPGLAQEFSDVCQEPENILKNCNFNSGLDHWQTFLETGSANFTVLQGGGECHAPLCPAAYIVSEDHFIGGLYQQVPVTQGANYYANIVWLVFDSLANDAAVHDATGGIGRRIGIDPFGGADPTSPSIVWSTDNWRNDCKICNIEEVTVTAQADTITVFLRIDNTWKVRAVEKGFPVPSTKDQFWIDDIGLKPVGGEPIAVEAAPPTNTPAPPTDTPVANPPTNTPTPEPQREPATEVAQENTPNSEEPVSPVATPTATPTGTPLPPPTLTPSATPSPTHTPRARISVTPSRAGNGGTNAQNSAELPVVLGAVGTTICFGGIILLIMSIVMAGLVWLYRLGWSNPDDEFDEYEEELTDDD